MTEHLTTLRQEISDLRTMNARYAERNQHSPVEQSAFVGRTNRLLEIKQQLSNMRNRPQESAVWWDKKAEPKPM